MRTSLILCLIGLFILFSSPSRADGKAKRLPVNYSWEVIQKTTPPAKQLELLGEKARHAKVRMGNFRETDSICHYGLYIASSSPNPNDYATAVNLYFQYMDLFNNSAEAIELANSLKNLEPNNQRANWTSYFYLCQAYEGAFDFEKSIECGKKAVALARELGDSLLVAKSMTALASTLNNNLEKVEALKLLLRAEDLFVNEHDDRAFHEFYDELRNFYIFINRFDECYVALEKQSSLIENSDELDSLDVLNVQFWQSYVDFSNPSTATNLDYIKSQLEFVSENSYMALREEYMSSYRTLLIRNNDFKGLYHLYNVIAPEQLESMKRNRPHDFFRLKAYFSESFDDLDSAEYYWKKSEFYMEQTADLYRLANFYIRMGEYFERTGQTEKALEKLSLAKDYGTRSGYLEFVLRATKVEERIYTNDGQFNLAYSIAEERRDIEDSLNLINAEEKFLMTTVLYQSQIAQTQQAAQLRTEFLRSRFFGIGFILFALLSGVIFFQFHQTRKAKRQSDSLLLNILPAETAQELKEFGATTARRYDQVTILFADFVGFTRLSEKLSPNDLVNEIDLYFRTFDEIMTKYGLEKIKTIGDAYLAVGGMPVGNQASASDVTRAAIAMQEAVNQINAQKEYRNLALRIGLHTGDVVAGVVGVTKFQYDVWGDAVNVAARMEQNSEPGKINISRPTYELVKNDFHVEYRGALDAKNKGLLDMYFVSRS